MKVTSNYIGSKDKQQSTRLAIDTIAGNLTVEEKEKLQSGEGFVKVPYEELCRQRVEVYPYLM